MNPYACEEGSVVGPIDHRVINAINKRFELDPDYLECMKHCHGGRPRNNQFHVGQEVGTVAFFLSLYDKQSTLPAPAQPHFEYPSLDRRVIHGVTYLLDYEHATSRALFQRILPFASTQDDMLLDRAHVDLLCFDYRTKIKPVPVVLWNAHKAGEVYFNWERLPFEDSFDDLENPINVEWDDFVVPLAGSFREFVSQLTK